MKKKTILVLLLLLCFSMPAKAWIVPLHDPYAVHVDGLDTLEGHWDLGGYNLTNGGAITGTSFVIGGNILTTSEWSFLDEQDQGVRMASNPTFNDLTVDTLTFNFATQDYKFISRSGSTLAMQSLTANANPNVEIYTQDGDGGNNELVNFSLIGKGTPTDITTALEQLNLQYLTNGAHAKIWTNAAGTGTVADLAIYTGANTTQLVLATDGDISMSGDLGVTGTVTAGKIYAGTVLTGGGGYINSLCDTDNLSSLARAVDVQYWPDASSVYASSLAGYFYNVPKGTMGGTGNYWGIFGGVYPDAGNFDNNATTLALTGLDYSVNLQNDFTGKNRGNGLTLKGIFLRSWGGSNGYAVGTGAGDDLDVTLTNYGAHVIAYLDGTHACTNAATNYGLYIETNDALDAAVTTASNSYALYLKSMANTNLNGGESYGLYSEDDVPSFFGGKVGIGTSSPDSVFHIKAGTPGTIGSHPAGQLIIQNPTDSVFSNAVITGYESDGDGNPDQQLWYLGSSSGSTSDIIFLNRRNSKLALGTNGTSRITVLGNGNVGIGTATPATKLDVVGTVQASDYFRADTAEYRRYYHLSVGGFDPGASGATWTNPSANTTGGWQLNAVGETLIAGTDIHADWDGASDIMADISFALNAGGSNEDTVDIKIVVYYNGVGDTATKTQTVEVATVTDGTQFKVYKAVFTLDYDAVDNVIDAGDKITFVLNLETDTSEIDDVIITHGSFYYNTTHVGIETGDI